MSMSIASPTTLESKQSKIAETYHFPLLVLISVISITHLANDFSAWKSRFRRSSDFLASRSAFVIPFSLRLFCLKSKELHSFVFPDFRRLATKKALASSRKSFSFFKRRISFSCSLTCWRSWSSSSLSVMALCGICEPAPRSRLPNRWVLTQPYMVLLGTPNPLQPLFVRSL